MTVSGFLARIEGAGYHGNSTARWLASQDAGAIWLGPFDFGDLLSHPEISGKQLTARTGYLVDGPRQMKLFLTARAAGEGERGVSLREKTFVAVTRDGGRSFSFESWIVPWQDPYRAAMLAPVQLDGDAIVVAVRRKSGEAKWIDCYRPADDGWAFVSRIDETEQANSHNGNPPALIRTADGRLCAAYGNRSTRQMMCRFSADGGETWGRRVVVQDRFLSANGFPDIGYPRLFQRSDGKLVIVYFWCTKERSQTHIEATIFDAEE